LATFGSWHEIVLHLASGLTTATLGSSESEEWYTPAEYIEAARRAMGVEHVLPAKEAAARKRQGSRTDLRTSPEDSGDVGEAADVSGGQEVSGDYVGMVLVALLHRCDWTLAHYQPNQRQESGTRLRVSMLVGGPELDVCLGIRCPNRCDLVIQIFLNASWATGSASVCLGRGRWGLIPTRRR
jgi:hypothetical protein